MARLSIHLPEVFPFATDIQVRIGDINYGNHLGNDALLSLVHEARVRFLRNLGFSELDIAGSGLMLTDVAIVYKSQAFYGDLLTVSMAVGDVNNYGCDFFYNITQNPSGKVVAHAKTGAVFFDYTRQKMVAVPAVFLRSVALTP